MPPKQASVNYDIKDKEVIKPCKKNTWNLKKNPDNKISDCSLKGSEDFSLFKKR
jgi:hypothetical protein